MKEQFMKLLVKTERPGIPNLLEYLGRSDFYIAPASAKYHGAHAGGLLEHSMAVYDAGLKLFCSSQNGYILPCSTKSWITVSLLHDICKVNFYKPGTRNVKNEATGEWEKVPCYTIDDQLPLGHGEKSVIILQQFLALTEEEALAIRWHMAGFEEGGYANRQALSAAMNKYPLITALHMADLSACFFGEK